MLDLSLYNPDMTGMFRYR